MDCTIRIAKTKALISFAAVTAKLICVYVFAYADCWFSHAAAHDVLHVLRDGNLKYVFHIWSVCFAIKNIIIHVIMLKLIV